MRQLTTKKVQDLISKKRFGRHLDSNGLYLNIRKPEGTASWLFRFTLRGKRTWMGFGGVTPQFGIEWARTRALEFNVMVRQGLDPREEWSTTQQISDQKQVSSSSMFSIVADQYIDSKRKGWRNTKHRKQWLSTLKTHVYPKLGSKPIDQIGIEDVLDVIKPIWHSKTETANRVRSRIELILDYASVLNLREGNNPAAWKGNIEVLLPSPKKIAKVKSHPALHYTQIDHICKAIGNDEGIPARALEFTILTASRSNPVRAAEWPEIDFKNAVWNCPGGHMKGGKLFRIPLSDKALAILHNQQKHSDSTLIFANARTGRMMSENAMTLVLHRLGLKSKATTHGMRSTFRDWAGETQNFSERLVEVCLAHTVNSASEAAYQRGDYIAKRRIIMDNWASFCYPNSNVIPISRISYDKKTKNSGRA